MRFEQRRGFVSVRGENLRDVPGKSAASDKGDKERNDGPAVHVPRERAGVLHLPDRRLRVHGLRTHRLHRHIRSHAGRRGRSYRISRKALPDRCQPGKERRHQKEKMNN